MEIPMQELAAVPFSKGYISTQLRIELDTITNAEWNSSGNKIARQLFDQEKLLASASSPSQIASIFSQLKQTEHNFDTYYKNLSEKWDDEIKRYLTSAKNAKTPDLNRLDSRKRDLDEKSDTEAAKFLGGIGAMGVVAPILDALGGMGIFSMLVYGGGAVAFGSGAANSITLSGSISEVEGDIKKIQDYLQGIEAETIADRISVSNYQVRQAFAMRLRSHIIRHAAKIHSELDRYASEHGTTSDEIYAFLCGQASSYEAVEGFKTNEAAALRHLLKGSYSEADLDSLIQYAQGSVISESPEQRALLQFINHSLIPHIDYCEIWASKVHDLKNSMNELADRLTKNTFEKRNGLEILNEKAVSLSGKKNAAASMRDQKERLKGEYENAIAAKAYEKAAELRDQIKRLEERIERFDNPVLSKAATEAAIVAEKQKNKAKERITNLFETLHDTQAGDLQDRHKRVCKETASYLDEFNNFFGGIDTALRRYDKELGQVIPQLDRMENRWNAYVQQATTQKLYDARNAKDTHIQNAVFNGLTIAATLMLDGVLTAHGIPSTHGVAALGTMVSTGEIRNIGIRVRQEAEQEIQQWAIMNQRKIDPEVVKKALGHLDAAFKELSENKEFLQFLSRNPTLEDVRALYMVLPRLRAGEINIDMIESRTKAAGYSKIDDFINDLNTTSPRLARAMENFLFGLADSNDLKVLVVEANQIKNPETPKDKVLVEYVEKAIKAHYRDQSRQASIIDHLQMRNVIYTGHTFHSFHEIVKRETDSALKALMEGKGNFSLIGSNDVHQMFSYYQARHGDRYFVSLYDKNRRAYKSAHVIPQGEIEMKADDTISSRDSATEIPHISSVFIENCAYEYLLTQGINTKKDRRFVNAPQVFGALEMVNDITNQFIEKLALADARLKKGSPNPETKRPELSPQIESLIAQSFVDFFSELGIHHHTDNIIQGLFDRLGQAYEGENFSLAQTAYTEAITLHAKNEFSTFLSIYRQNLENYLERATRDNKDALLKQLAEVEDIMHEIQPNNIVLPDSEEARLRAHYRNHSLSNLGINTSTWVARTDAIYKGGREIGS